jgi:hypothetical protein
MTLSPIRLVRTPPANDKQKHKKNPDVNLHESRT